MKDTQTPDSLRPGCLVGPWRLEDYGGRGTYGVVYKARRAGHPGSLPVALKLALFPHDPRFAREEALLTRNQHPAFPRLVDRGWWQADSEQVHPYLAMEWIRGLPLYDWARVHQATARKLLRVTAQVAWGLEVLHRAGCVHRDVKGDNILVEPEGRAVLADFGSGTWAGAPPITERVMPPNTPEYRSPEALRFHWAHWREQEARYEARPADDLYALGISLYRLVTSRYPPPGTDPEAGESSQRVRLLPRLPSQEYNTRVVPELSDLIERMLARAPEARGTARELAETAEAVAEHAGPDADVPLLGPERPVPETVMVPVSWEPVVGSERAVSAAEVVPAGTRLLPDQNKPAGDPMAVPAHTRAAPHTPFNVMGIGLLAAALVLMATSMGGRSHQSYEEPLEVAQVEELDGSATPDAGTSGLGDSTLTTRVTAEGPPSELDAKVLAADMPEQPLPGQQRAPCKGYGQVTINGGCWRRLADVPPNCGEDGYEWKRVCYHPVLERKQPRTSESPR